MTTHNDDYTLTDEEIARHYSAAMDSVNLINRLLAQLEIDTEDEDSLDRNARHLELMVEKDYWTDEDLGPFHEAISDVREFQGE